MLISSSFENTMNFLFINRITYFTKKNQLCDTKLNEKNKYFASIYSFLEDENFEKAHKIILQGMEIISNDEVIKNILIGELNLQINNWQNAKLFFKTAADREFTSKEAHVGYFKALLQQRDLKIAEQYLLNIHDKFSSDSLIAYHAADFYMQQKEWDRSAFYWNKYCESVPQDITGYSKGCLCTLYSDNKNICDTLLKKMEEKFPRTLELLITQVDILIYQQNFNEVAGLLKDIVQYFSLTKYQAQDIFNRLKALKNHSDYRDILFEMYNKYGDEIWCRIAVSEYLIEEGKAKEAEEILDTFINDAKCIENTDIIRLFKGLKNNKELLFNREFFSLVKQGYKTFEAAVADHREFRRYDKGSIVFDGLSLKAVDINTKRFNVCNGERLTPYCPADYINTIYLFGDSKLHGTELFDDQNFSSYLQKFINQSNAKYRVINVTAGGSPIENMFLMFLEKDFKKGDYALFEITTRQYGKINYLDYYLAMKNICDSHGVIIKFFLFPTCDLILNKSPFEEHCAQLSRKNNFSTADRIKIHRHFIDNFCRHGFDIVDLHHIFHRPHSFGEVFYNHNHLSASGCRAAAEYLYKLWFSKPHTTVPVELLKKMRYLL